MAKLFLFHFQPKSANIRIGQHLLVHLYLLAVHISHNTTKDIFLYHINYIHLIHYRLDSGMFTTLLHNF